MMDKKKMILKRMQEEVENAHTGDVEPLIGESYMSVEFVHYMLKTTFEKTFIPEHILDIIMLQNFPLNKMYEYFVDQGCFNNEVDWTKLCKEYALYIELDHISEKLHDKVKVEYKAFMEAIANKSPNRMKELLSEISFKMQAFSLFRYEQCFQVEDMNRLLRVDHLLDKAYKKYQGEPLSAKDLHYLWATTLECLGRVSEDERGSSFVEEDALEA